jgi:hypothetical protein
MKLDLTTRTDLPYFQLQVIASTGTADCAPSLACQIHG